MLWLVISAKGHGCGVLVFVINSCSRVRKFRTPDPDSGTKKLELRLQA